MPKYSNNRVGRIADQIHKDLVAILRLKVKDQRIKEITIHEVEVSADYSWAKIYWTTLQNDNIQQLTKLLSAAAGFIRSELAQQFNTYTIPQLKFIYDSGLERGNKILQILDQVKLEEKILE